MRLWPRGFGPAITETGSTMKWLICRYSMPTNRITDEQQQCGYDVVSLDRREMWAVQCSVHGHCRTNDETAVILQSLSRFSNAPDSRAVDLWEHADTRFHLRPLRKIGRNHVGRNRNMAESHFRGSFGAGKEAVAGIRSASNPRGGGLHPRIKFLRLEGISTFTLYSMHNVKYEPSKQPPKPLP